MPARKIIVTPGMLKKRCPPGCRPKAATLAQARAVCAELNRGFKLEGVSARCEARSSAPSGQRSSWLVARRNRPVGSFIEFWDGACCARWSTNYYGRKPYWG